MAFITECSLALLYQANRLELQDKLYSTLLNMFPLHVKYYPKHDTKDFHHVSLFVYCAQQNCLNTSTLGLIILLFCPGSKSHPRKYIQYLCLYDMQRCYEPWANTEEGGGSGCGGDAECQGVGVPKNGKAGKAKSLNLCWRLKPVPS